MVTYVHTTESGGQQAMHRSLCWLAFIALALLDDGNIIRATVVPSHWTAEHITRYERFMQFLQQRWDLNAAAAEFATSLMINMRPWTPEATMHEAAHAVTKQDLLRMADVVFVDNSYAETQAVISTGSHELVDFEILRLTSMCHWSTAQRSRYESIMKYLKQHWGVDATSVAQNDAVVNFFELVCWFSSHDHPLSTNPTQERIEVALKRAR
eukprot:14806-Heterococcus_DN1.PRE.5